ncbi:hypothetical protein PhaeoP97_03090 [Phaeobacter porticola]|uniref:Uncharacterized protein n=1 Tax=Phaeobacter porticola TaxID=1844006 RepID=A0A1L3I8U8_9RHOB|nr:hypothetical protein PhaeoP97_03090 [Phaeobacter porticola]
MKPQITPIAERLVDIKTVRYRPPAPEAVIPVDQRPTMH